MSKFNEVKYRELEEVLIDIESLVKSKGYIYTLCMIIVEDFHISAEELHNVDYRSRLNRNELTLLLGFLIKKGLNTDHPESFRDLLKNKKITYRLMDELHTALSIPSMKKFKPLFEQRDTLNSLSKEDFFGGDNMFIEPIFYAGDGIYDFQYSDYLLKKYKYDEIWLSENKNFNLKSTKNIISKIRETHNAKFKKVDFISLKENKEKIIDDFRKRTKHYKKYLNHYLSFREFFQFIDFFSLEEINKKQFIPDKVNEFSWKLFYSRMLDLFTVNKADFEDQDSIDFLNNFSIDPKAETLNSNFNSVGDFNVFASKPIICLDNEKYFIPVSFSLFEAAYESPFYWMIEDKNYRNTAAKNRGNVGEEMTYDLLEKVFGAEHTFKSVLIESKKGYSDTDIDILCVLGDKAICVQVKSKKLPHVSRRGSYDQLRTDFKGAVQDAYEQGLVCRNKILEGESRFYDENHEKINSFKNINEVYILGVTTENYPTLTHQSNILLKKDDDDPYPLFLTIFDLELASHYLSNPYQFLYYVQQRTKLMDYHQANEEIHFLGYHLMSKLWKDPNSSFMMIDGSYGQLVDRNYYPFKSGIITKKENDKIETRWRNKKFDTFCSQISEIDFSEKTDVILHFLDWSHESIDNLTKRIQLVKEKTIIDRSRHDFSMFPGLERSAFGFTFISWDNDNIKELNENLSLYCELRKYKNKASYWVGVGSLSHSGRMVDSIVVFDEEWEYNQTLEKEVREFFSNVDPSKVEKIGKKIGRNDFCPCSSGKKYKKCCGRNF